MSLGKLPLAGGSFLPVLLFALGCGSSGPPQYVLKGKVTKGGEVMAVTPMVGGLDVMFYRIGDTKEPVDPIPAILNFANGTFEVRGHDGRGIPAGKYKITVEWRDNHPLGPDKLKGLFNQANSKIIRDIPGSGDIILDVSKPEG